MKKNEWDMTEVEAAKYLGIHPRTLRTYRAQGTGPRYSHPVKKILRYRRADLDEWMASGAVEGA